ncbi:MAG: hypothetical protein M1818_002712 [Claussenomyces sp. TS43310]|nr:MAG: hypothetical protein M1818_002712 [Claussenomyces sp. TS43310]
MASPFSVSNSYAKIQAVIAASPSDASPKPADVKTAAASLPTSLPTRGRGEAEALAHLLKDLTPGFNGSKTSPNYYGFVTGGMLPIAEAADNIVTAWDQNVQVHQPESSVSTTVEDRALAMLIELLELNGDGRNGSLEGNWMGRTFTTGATGSNILGLACGREAVIAKRIAARGAEREEESVGELGLLEACRLARIGEIQVLTTMGHSSLHKAASVVGLGRRSVKDVGLREQPWKFDLQRLEQALSNEGTASIVVVSCGEVNTGRYATDGVEEMKRIRILCDSYGAWLHVDGAFGLFSRALPKTDEFASLHDACAGIELADSITGDAHKCLNVPYDCGFFLTPSSHTLPRILLNPNAAYLATAATTGTAIPSPLHIGLENSRRFRALPVYAVLVAHGRASLAALFARQVRLARRIASCIRASAAYELLPSANGAAADDARASGIIVLFRARDAAINADLVDRLNRSGKIYVSGTRWQGRPACRIAVATWKVDEERDLAVVRTVLEEALL